MLRLGFGHGLGILPITKGAQAPGPNTTTGTFTTGLPFLAENTCTADGKMMWSQGAWRVASQTDKCAASIADDWENVVNTYLESVGHKYFVGPFPIQARLLLTDTDPDGDNSWEITEIGDPADIPRDWVPKLREVLKAAAVANKSFAIANPNPPQIVSPARPAKTDPHCKPLPNGNCDLIWGWDGSPYVSVDGTTWMRMQGDDKIWRTYVKRGDDPSDPNLFKQLQFVDWWQALGLSQSEWSAIAYGTPLTRDNMTRWQGDYDPTAGVNIPPVAKWKHPKTGDDWGLWLSIVPLSHASGVWDSALHQPPWGTKLQIGFGPIPQEPWYETALDGILWLPSTVLEVAEAIVETTIDAIHDLICSGFPCPGKDPATLAACAAVKATCSSPTPVPPAKPPTPWYLQWYVVVPAAIVGAFILFGNNKRAASPTT